MEKDYLDIGRKIITHCGDLNPWESILIISDDMTKQIGEIIESSAKAVTDKVKHCIIPQINIHGEEPSEQIASEMIHSDLIVGLTKYSLAHTKARFNASLAGARYLSMPDFSFSVLESDAFEFNFRGATPLANKIAYILSKGKYANIKTDKGTNLVLELGDRIGNSAPGWCFEKGSIASPPDSEVNIPPVEDKSHGRIIVDGSIPCKEIGLLNSDLTLTLNEGRIIQIEGEKAELLASVLDRGMNPATRILAEFGIGLNNFASLGNSMLEDEGTLGTAHFGFGSNSTIGGKNNVPFHLDMVVRDVSIFIDNNPIMIQGKLNYSYLK